MIESVQLSLGLQMPQPIRRYALFKDFRGVLYCEPVDEMIQIYEKPYPAREAIYERKGLFGKRMAHPYRAAGVNTETVFDPALCNRSDYVPDTRFDATDLIAKGFVRSTHRVYLQENFWGPVIAIDITTDLDLGKSLQEKLWLLTPEGNRMVGLFDTSGLKHRIRDARPIFTLGNEHELLQAA